MLAINAKDCSAQTYGGLAERDTHKRSFKQEPNHQSNLSTKVQAVFSQTQGDTHTHTRKPCMPPIP